jgi:putative acetyltransferase
MYKEGDANVLVRIFFAAVRELARAKYSDEQVRAWAPRVPDPSEWEARMLLNETFVAERNGELVGFIELERSGRLAMLYRTPAAAGKGAAEALYHAVEERAREIGIPRIRVEASLLAESFFMKRGYRLEARETVERNGAALPRARLSKDLP